MKRAVIRSTGAYLPEKILTNHDLARMVDTSHEWIVERTGIEQRHIAAEGELTSDLATRAARQAIAAANVDANSVDLIIVATATPDDTMPATANKVQHQLGMANGASFDLNAACSGFVYALGMANACLQTGQAKRALVIGAETFSRIIDWKDRNTCILFGDGAGAMLLDAVDEKSAANRGILSVCLHADGQFAPILNTSGGVSATQTSGTVFMAGKEVYRHAVAKMPQATEECMKALNLPISAIDWLVPHQANGRILQSVAEKLGIPADKAISTVAMHANTSAASIPLALHTAAEGGRINPGQLVVCPALGAGLTWGCAAMRW